MCRLVRQNKANECGENESEGVSLVGHVRTGCRMIHEMEFLHAFAIKLFVDASGTHVTFREN